MPPDSNPQLVDVLVIGAGFSGIGLGIKLRKAGVESFVILERGADVGGTWRSNTYPGCACDVPSHLYSLSFEQNPGWSRMYPTQPELRDYLAGLADKHGLRSRMRFDSEVVEAVFDAEAGRWAVRTRDGSSFDARVVVSGMGGLSRPMIPAFPGLERFRGPAFHSANWDHSFDMTGKRVAVVGTGASAIQFVPQIAPKVARLDLYQRTPPWILPKPDRPIRAWEQRLFRWLPGYGFALRNYLYWRQEILGVGYTLQPRLLKLAEKLALNYLREAVPDPELRAKLTPDYRIGCKRVLLTNDYLQAMSRPNLEVITQGVAAIGEHSVTATDGREREVDAIVFGTGFKTLDFTSPVRFVGSGGRELNEVWSGKPRAYFGVATAGFPNLFFITGPNSRVANNSIVFMIEVQIHYVVQCIRRILRGDARTLEVRREAQDAYNRALTRRARGTVFATGCRSWYLDENGESPVLWPGFSSEFWWKARSVRWRDFATG